MTDFSSLEEAVRARATELFERAVEATRQATADAAPTVTGQLAAGHRVENMSDNGTVLSADLVVDPEYAGYVAHGTRPHEIRPRNARVLRFEIGGEVIYATKVNHPGTQPNPEWWSEGALAERWTDALETETA